ncbi:MAG: methyltransferase domain-containing protein [Proteobacteria bacterium]|nr:methyltransferase domain-containing protein [Pseudomonadota bacterium]
MSLPENSYGRVKRLDFVAHVVREVRACTILDMGCGTGSQLTRPLAELFPDVAILGIDADGGSIAWAQAQPRPANLSFSSDDALAAATRFDLVIASEVVEHVDDPVAFLARLKSLVATGGRLIVTVPNGYGPFELMSLIEVGLNLSGAQNLLRAIKYRGAAANPTANETTLAISPHINFFSVAELRRLFVAAGLAERRFRPTTFLCGYGIDSLMRAPRVITWNARIADRLPAWMSSDWMFVLQPVAETRPAAWRRNAWARFRRRLNERRWGLVRGT